MLLSARMAIIFLFYVYFYLHPVCQHRSSSHSSLLFPLPPLSPPSPSPPLRFCSLLPFPLCFLFHPTSLLNHSLLPPTSLLVFSPYFPLSFSAFFSFLSFLYFSCAWSSLLFFSSSFSSTFSFFSFVSWTSLSYLTVCGRHEGGRKSTQRERLRSSRKMWTRLSNCPTSGRCPSVSASVESYSLGPGTVKVKVIDTIKVLEMNV